MTPEEFKTKMEQLADEYFEDEETMHARMDDVMCDLLTDLGYGEGIDIFTLTPKYYG